ncbi:MAG TPA: nicotinamide-nucleotide adenylyltransferase [Candidatus Bathyarchaeia archaeon]|nr:nicotinamide-nucleotide adenylyltransferase [Candidatus Bathyarchaeia archaeon]
MPTRGVYVGRFQPFHLGHLDAIKRVLDEVEEIVVVIGSAQYSHNVNNPFTAGERLVMVRNALEEAEVDFARVWVVPVPDVHLHMMWVAAVEGYTPKFQIVYSNEALTRRLFMESGYKIKGIPFFERQFYSSTIVREKMLIDDSWKTLVPKNVADFIVEIDGINRVRELNLTDKV